MDFSYHIVISIQAQKLSPQTPLLLTVLCFRWFGSSLTATRLNAESTHRRLIDSSSECHHSLLFTAVCTVSSGEDSYFHNRETPTYHICRRTGRERLLEGVDVVVSLYRLAGWLAGEEPFSSVGTRPAAHCVTIVVVTQGEDTSFIRKPTLARYKDDTFGVSKRLHTSS